MDAVIVDCEVCRFCGAEVTLDTSDTGPGSYMSHHGYPIGWALECTFTDPSQPKGQWHEVAEDDDDAG